MKNYVKGKTGGGYEREGVVWASITGEWDVSIRREVSQRNPRVNKEKGGEP